MADFAKEALAQDINIVSKFETNLSALLAVLGKTDVQVVAPGTAVKVYKSSGTLKTAAVSEGAEIPVSGYKMELSDTVELTYAKYRNVTGIESIGKMGYEVAVGGSNDAMLKDVQKAVRKSIYDGIATGTGTATGATFQAALANAWAGVETAFEDEAATPVFFANPLDVAGYLGTAQVTVQTAFGMNYVENFMGLGSVIIDSNVAKGTVIGTAQENLDVIAANVASIPGMEMQTDASGIIAVHNGAKYANAGIETVAYCGLKCFPVFLDRVVKATISA